MKSMLNINFSTVNFHLLLRREAKEKEDLKEAKEREDQKEVKDLKRVARDTTNTPEAMTTARARVARDPKEARVENEREREEATET